MYHIRSQYTLEQRNIGEKLERVTASSLFTSSISLSCVAGGRARFRRSLPANLAMRLHGGLSGEVQWGRSTGGTRGVWRIHLPLLAESAVQWPAACEELGALLVESAVQRLAA